MKTYTVQRGDSLLSIAQRFLGDRSQYKLIVQLNRIRNANAIRVGQKLKIPNLEGSQPTNPWGSLPSMTPPANSRDLSLLNDLQLREIMPYSRPENRAKFLVPLNKTMRRYGIISRLRKAHFLSQIAHESGSLKYTEELASGEAYEGRRVLGNIHRGDGVRFKGRGLIQLTGRTNYNQYKKHSGLDVIRKPQLIAENPNVATDVAGWFWMVRRLNRWADKDNVRALTFRVNGGYNGLQDRQQHLTRAKRVFGI